MQRRWCRWCRDGLWILDWLQYSLANESTSRCDQCPLLSSQAFRLAIAARVRYGAGAADVTRLGLFAGFRNACPG